MSRHKFEAKQWMRLKQLHAEHPDWDIKQLASAMHTTRFNLYMVTRYHNYEIDLRRKIPLPRLGMSEKKEMVAMYINGGSINDIAEYYEVSTSVVYYWLKKFHIRKPKMRNPRYLDRDIQIASLAARGKTDKEIGDLMGKTECAIGNYKTRIRLHTSLRIWVDILDELKERKKELQRKYNQLITRTND